MTQQVIKTKDFRRFLEAHKCKYNRTSASHEIWKCPKCFRSITFQGAKKTIPEFHIRTNLKTMGLTLSYFYEWVNKN